ncbi:MAG: Gfo/Idh/MocA family protein [Acidimicrobiia bacterium]
MTSDRPDSRTLGVVVVGTGFGCITHVRALRAAGLNVVAVVGRDPERTRERAQKFGVPVAVTSLDRALTLDGVDAVTIATPPHTHGDIALTAIAAGKHVICEKPFARDAFEARRMLAAAQIAGIVHVLGTEFRWDPGQATLARTVRSGAIGEPRLATVLLHVPVLADPAAEVPGWWADRSSGGGWLGAHGSQVIDQLRVTLGEFVRVSAALPHLAPTTRTAEDAFVVHFETQSGCAGVMQSTAADWGPPVVVTRVAGTHGTAWIEGVGAKVKVADRAGTHTVAVGTDLATGNQQPEPLPPGVLHSAYDHMIAHGFDLGPYTRLAAAFRDLILGNNDGSMRVDDPRPATFVDGVAGMEVLDAVRRSSQDDGAWVDVPAGIGL